MCLELAADLTDTANSAQIISPPLPIYPTSLQQDVEAVQRWMPDCERIGPYGGYFVREPFRPDTAGTGSAAFV